jgi:hypothetical protein
MHFAVFVFNLTFTPFPSELTYQFFQMLIYLQDYSRKMTKPDQVKMQLKIHFT